MIRKTKCCIETTLRCRLCPPPSPPVVGVYPGCSAKGEGPPHPGGVAEDRQRPGGVRRGHRAEKHGPGRQEQRAHWWVVKFTRTFSQSV